MSAEIIAYLKSGSGYHADGRRRRTHGARHRARTPAQVLPVCTWLQGEYGPSDLYLGVPAVLGREEVRAVVELPARRKAEPLALRRCGGHRRRPRNEAEEPIAHVTQRAAGPSVGTRTGLTEPAGLKAEDREQSLR